MSGGCGWSGGRIGGPENTETRNRERDGGDEAKAEGGHGLRFLKAWDPSPGGRVADAHG